MVVIDIGMIHTVIASVTITHNAMPTFSHSLIVVPPATQILQVERVDVANINIHHNTCIYACMTCIRIMIGHHQ